MKRYYICRRLGNGAGDNPFYSELRVYIQANYPSEPRFSQQIIAHTIPWVVMCYDLSDVAHTNVMASLTGIFSFPSGALSTQVSDILVAKKTAIQNKLTDMGFEFTWATGVTTIREILEYLCHSIQLSEWCNMQILAQNFDINKRMSTMRIVERYKIVRHLTNLGIDTGWIAGDTTNKEIAAKVRSDRQYLFRDND